MGRHTTPFGGFSQVTESGLWLSDTTVADVSTARHGFAPKLPNDATKYLDGTGAYTTPGGTPGSVVPESYHYTTWEKKSVPGANAFVSVGNPQTITGAGTTATNNDADGAFIKHSTSTTINTSTSQIAANLTTTKRDWLGIHIARTKTDSDLTSLRFWCGWFTNTPVAGSDPTGHCAAFRFDTGAGDTQFMCCTKDGSTLNATASGITPATTTLYLLRVEMAASSVLFYINDTLVHTSSSNLPGASTSMGEVFALTTLSAAVRSWNLSSLRMMHYQ